MDRFENPLEKRTFKKGTQTYWKLRGIADELLQQQKKCSICGSEKDLTVHHVIKCENNEVLYVNPDNLIVLCSKCHAEYHQKYYETNPKTLIEFILTKDDKKRKKRARNQKRRRMKKKWKYYFISWRPKNENN